MQQDGVPFHEVRSGVERLLLAAGALAGYVAAFLALYFGAASGPAATDLSGAAVAAIGWLLGRWAGLAAGLLTLPLNATLLALVGPAGADALGQAAGGPALVANVVIGLAVGWMGELHRRVKGQARALARDHETLTHEVAERKRAEDQLRDGEELFRLIAENAGDMLSLWDPRGRLVYCSPAYTRIMGHAPPESLETLFAERFHPDDLGAATAALARALAGSLELLTFRLRHADGTWRWLEAWGTMVPWRGGRYLLGVARDVTGRLAAEEARRRSHEQYEALVASVEGIVWECDLPGFTFTFVSPYAEQLLGYPARRWLDEPDFWPTHLHPDDRDEAVRQCRAATEALRDHEVVYRMTAADGRVVWLRDLVKVVVEGGRAVKLRGVMVEVTEQKRAEAALCEEQKLTRRILEAVPAGVILVRPDGCVADANGHARRLLGLSDDLLGRLNLGDRAGATFREDGAPFPVEDYPASRCLRTGEPQPAVALGVRRRDGSVFWGMFSATPASPDPATGRPTGAVVTFLDITERRRLEEELRQAHKLEAIGRLAGGVAHDFNNLLTVINGYADLLADGLPAGGPDRGYAEEVRKAGARAAALTRQLLAFGRKQVVQPRVLDLNAVLAGMRGMLGRLLGADVALRTEPAPRLPPVRADPAQLEQVILNLAVNARDAMPEGGRLTIRTAAVRFGDGAEPPGGIAPGSYVLLEVADTGAGMTEEVRSRVFEPFFTTKELGKGTGLGLATVYGIVKQSGGHIDVDSAPGRGTTFRVWLPSSAEPVREPEPAAASRPPWGRGEAILLVEDDPHVRALAAQFLRQAGYSVVEAPTAPDALSRCAPAAGPIDLLLTDVIMPELSGPVLAQQARQLRPGLKVLFMSGHTDDAVLRRAIRDEDVPFLQKPFSPDALARKVREVLGG
jgi:PAS domain S-box-containing protein